LSIDLNLLTVFDAIMTDRNLTAAAKRLGRTQSAVSHSLRRLRDVTGDPLFELTGRGVRPTARAAEMAEEVRRALDVLQRAVSARNDFDPMTETRSFLVDIPVGLECIVGPLLAERVSKLPGITFRVSSSRAAIILRELRLRETWLALDFEPTSDDGYRNEILFEDELVLVARRDHPELVNGLKPSHLKDLDHVGIAWPPMLSPAYHPIDQRFQAAGLTRPVVLWLPTLPSMISVVEGTDLVGCTISRVANAFARKSNVEVHRLPVRMPPVPLLMVWHESLDDDAGHRWLRDVMRSACDLI